MDMKDPMPIQPTLEIRNPSLDVFCAVAEGSERSMLASLCGRERGRMRQVRDSVPRTASSAPIKHSCEHPHLAGTDTDGVLGLE